MRHGYWDPKWVIKTYDDFKRNNFLINNDGYITEFQSFFLQIAKRCIIKK